MSKPKIIYEPSSESMYKKPLFSKKEKAPIGFRLYEAQAFKYYESLVIG